jgi:O-succinylbenzoate synthase
VKALIDFGHAPVFAIPMLDGFGGKTLREGMLVEGPQGWGEFSPEPNRSGAALTRWLTAAIEPGTVGWPDAVRGRIPIAVKVPATDAARAHQIVSSAGCRSADVAVGSGARSLDDDVARLEAVRDALGPDGAIRCNAGGQWDIDTAVAAIAALGKAAGGLEYVEQPCHTLDDMAAVRRRVDVRIAVHGSIRARPDPRRRSLADVADLMVLFCGALGGVRRALRMAEASELPCVVCSEMETSVGLAGGLALAGALPELPYACGLGTRLLLDGDVVTESRSLVPVDGYLPVAPMPPAPDPNLLARHAVTDSERVAWWRDRLRVAHADI